MPFAYAGHCYATTGEALEAFQVSFPRWGDVNVVGHVSSSIDGAGVLSYSVLTRPIASNTVSSRTGTIQLATCSAVDAPEFDAVAAGGVFAFFFLGAAGTWYLSQNLGLILEAVKKW